MDEQQERTHLTLDAYWQMAVRRRWLLLGPLFALGLLAAAAAHLWPKLYRSEALVLVEAQKVPEQFVMSNVVSDLQERLQAMTQQILSRTRLRDLIERFELYPRERAHKTMDEVIDYMRKRISIELVQTPGRQSELTAFRIYYSADDPKVAQRLTNELTSLFIEENLQARTQQSVGTTSFLENQLEKARGELAQQEERQRQYKLRFLGQLPEQQQSNLQILGSLEAQLRASTAALERAEQQKVYLESMRAEYGAMRRSLVEMRASGVRPAGVETAEAAVRDIRKQLTEMETRYTPRHPDMVKVREELARWEELKRRAAAEPVPVSASEAASNASADTSAIEVQSRLKAVALEIETRRRDVDELRQRLRQFQSRLDLTPVREQQLAEVTRSYENSRQYFQSLLQKKLQSELATNLEKRQQGEQFRILDPATMPRKAVTPDRGQITLAGWLIGLCLGLVLAAIAELADKTVHSQTELGRMTNLPVLGRIPVLLTTGEEQIRRKSRWMEAVAATVLVVTSVSASLYTYLAS